MFCKTINEWRKNVQNAKPVNEGGGSGISFVTNASIYYKGKLTKDGIEITESTVNDNSFSATGYQDGMNDVKGSLIKWQAPVITREMILGITLAEGFGTVESVLNDANTESIDFQFEAYYKYDNMHFGGYIRGKFEIGDVVFSQELNYNKQYDFDDAVIDLTANVTDGQNILDESDDNGSFFEKLAPVGTATEDFMYFYKDVFEYDSDQEAKALAYSELLDFDVYDETLAEYMEMNGIDMTIDDYKESLKNDKQELPTELYNYLDENQGVADKADEMHWSDAKANYGA